MRLFVKICVVAAVVLAAVVGILVAGTALCAAAFNEISED